MQNDFQYLSYTFYGNVALLQVNKPQSLNALSKQLLDELGKAIDLVENDGNIKTIIITGVGKAFVAGADISEMKDMTADEARDYANHGAKLFHKIETLNKVTIAAINGFALGGGCELAMACDIRIASEKAKLGQPEVGLGIIPGFSGIRRMVELIGEAKAKDLIFSGRIFDAFEAERVGIVNKVVNTDTLMDECKRIAEEISLKSFNAVITSKKVINALKTGVEEKVIFQSDCFACCFEHPDQKEGMTAFLEKRVPSFI